MPKHRITFKRTQFFTVETDGFPNSEAAKIQAEVTPGLVGLRDDSPWESRFGSISVHAVEEIDSDDAEAGASDA